MRVEGRRTRGECRGSKVEGLILHVDGAARGNPGPAGIGGIIFDERGLKLCELSEYIGETTNNIAEYSALLRALELARPYGRVESIQIHSDSELLVRQLEGTYKVKNPTLKSLFDEVKCLLRAYKRVEVYHVPRRENAGADKLANKAIDGYLR
ncbi:MAG: ribonuclease HI family protein [Actinomycetota bacterium]